MADKNIPDSVVKGVVEYGARLSADIEQTEKAIAKAKEDLISREELLVSMRRELAEVEGFLKVNAPKTDQTRPWITTLYAPKPSGLSQSFIWADARGLHSPPKGQVVPTEAGVKLHSMLRLSASGKKAVVIEAAIRMMTGGKRVSTVEIVDKLTEWGVDLEVSSPSTRVSQILSEDDRFVTARGVGWWLKGEDPGATGSSSATN